MSKKDESKLYNFVPVIFCGLSIPLAIFMWLGNVTFMKFLRDPETDENYGIPPTRWLFATFTSLSLMVYAVRRKSVLMSAGILGFVISVILSIASHAFFACLLTFFLTSSKATKFRGHMKNKFEKDFHEEGRRNWVQVFCNGGVPTFLALLYLMDCGSGERPINFATSYRCSWLGIGVLGCFACCNGDTWASELGSVLSTSDPFLIISGKRVPRGTNGGVSFPGLLVSLLGGLLIGIAYYMCIVYCTQAQQLLVSPSQWPIILCGGFAGLYGSLVDSLLGATVQYSGVDAQGKIVEKPGPNVNHISGLSIIDNHSVNLISTIVTAFTLPIIAAKLWPEI